MKVLFAIGNPQTSKSVIEQYKDLFNDDIEYKDVFYFKALLEEVKKDKEYDRIVINEELEQAPSTSLEDADKFIFNNIDKITDEIEASKSKIILICSDRRTRSDSLLSKLYGNGIYSILLGDDRSISNLCNVIKNPKTKKEAKEYLRIDYNTSLTVDSVESDETVEEDQLISIIKYYDRLGDDTSKYIYNFDRIAEQYTPKQLKVIAAVLPAKVQDVLRTSDKYGYLYIGLDNPSNDSPKQGTKVTLLDRLRKGLNSKEEENRRREEKRIIAEQQRQEEERLEQERQEEIRRQREAEMLRREEERKAEEQRRRQEEEARREEERKQREQRAKAEAEAAERRKQEELERENRRREEEAARKAEDDRQKADLEAKRKAEEDRLKAEQEAQMRALEEARKKAEEEKARQTVEQNVIISVDEAKKQDLEKQRIEEENRLRLEQEAKIKAEQEAIQRAQEAKRKADEEARIQAEFEAKKKAEEEARVQAELAAKRKAEEEARVQAEMEAKKKETQDFAMTATQTPGEYTNYVRTVYEVPKDYKKVVALVGANKSGNTFILNAIANNIANKRINTAILDMTKDKGIYYIYNRDDARLRKIALDCMKKLSEGVDTFIPANKFLHIYTSIPGTLEENRRNYKHKALLETVRKNNNLILVDCDFTTPIEYFEQASEIYIVQDLDILKLQDTTLFLRELKSKNVDMSKIKVIINKYVKTVLSPKKLIEGLSYYNDPEMSFVDELLSGKVIYTTIPFRLENYANYVEGLYRNNINYQGYTQDFRDAIEQLCSQVYPVSGTTQKRRGLFG